MAAEDGSRSCQAVAHGQDASARWSTSAGLDGVDLDLYPGEVLAVIGDNGAGKSTLIKCLTGALVPDAGEILGSTGEPVHFRRRRTRATPASRPSTRPSRSRRRSTSPATSTSAASSAGAGPLGSVLRMLDRRACAATPARPWPTWASAPCRTWPSRSRRLSGGQRQAVAVARAAAFGSKVIILDEPTAALGVKESNQVLKMIERCARAACRSS